VYCPRGSGSRTPYTRITSACRIPVERGSRPHRRDGISRIVWNSDGTVSYGDFVWPKLGARHLHPGFLFMIIHWPQMKGLALCGLYSFLKKMKDSNSLDLLRNSDGEIPGEAWFSSFHGDSATDLLSQPYSCVWMPHNNTCQNFSKRSLNVPSSPSATQSFSPSIRILTYLIGKYHLPRRSQSWEDIVNLGQPFLWTSVNTLISWLHLWLYQDWGRTVYRWWI